MTQLLKPKTFKTPPKLREYMREYQRKKYWANPEKARKLARHYIKTHPEQRKKRYEAVKRWRKNHPEMYITNYRILEEQEKAAASFQPTQFTKISGARLPERKNLVKGQRGFGIATKEEVDRWLNGADA